MLVKITNACDIGCKHCLSDCTPNKPHMDIQTFKDVIKFINKRYVGILLISGGEPTQHPSFIEFMNTMADKLSSKAAPAVCITSNGFWLTENEKNIQIAKDIISRFKMKGIELSWQISTDRRYYPKRINVDHKIFKEDRESFVLCDNCVDKLAPLGRAKGKNLPGEWRVGSSCFNIRAVARQIKDCSFNGLLVYMADRGKFCTPSVEINGDICLSESSLCKPSGSNIYSSDEDIIKSIINFKCEECGVNYSLPRMYKDVLGI